MRTFFRNLILGSITVAALIAAGGSPAKADDGYWRGHWRWYDNNYSPYYRHNHHYYYGNMPYYGNTYYYPYYGGYYNGYYGPGYYGNYYRGGGSVSVGPLQFGWW
jgi:hypothetical protein